MPRSRITTVFDFRDVNASVLQRVNHGIRNFSQFVFSPAGAIAGAGALAGAIGAVTGRYLENADALQKMSIRTGLSTEELGALTFAFEQADLTANDLQRTVSRLNDRGISLDDFADQIANIDDISGRTSLAVDVLGERLGPRLLSVLDQGSEGLDRYREAHQRLGLSIDQESAEAAARINDNLDTINRVVAGFGTRIGQAVVNWAGPLIEGAGMAFGILPVSAEEETQAVIDEFISRLADATSTGQSLGEALTDPVIAQLAEMAHQAGVQTASAFAAAQREILRRSAQSTAEAYGERYLDIQQDIALGSGERIRPHRNLPIAPGSGGLFESIQYDFDRLAGGERRDPAVRSDQRTYSNRRFGLWGTAGLAGYAVGQFPVPHFAEADPISRSIIQAFSQASEGDGFNPFLNRETAQLQTEAIRANQIVVEDIALGGGGGGGFGGSVGGQGLIDASKEDPVRVTIAAIGGLDEDAARNQKNLRPLRIDGNDLINADALRDLIFAIIRDYGI